MKVLSRSGRACARAILALLRLARTIRGRITLAFLALSLIIVVLGGLATLGIRSAGELVDKTYDRSLMSINYARAAAADFAGMQAAAARMHIAASGAERATFKDRLDQLADSFDDDLSVALERGQSDRAGREGVAAKAAVTDWLDAQRRFGLRLSADIKPVWTELDGLAAAVEQHLDLLINVTAGDGFTYRQAARATVARDVNLSVAAMLVALVLSGAVALLLAMQIVQPVAAASQVATRIAAGDLSVEVPDGGGDEFGALLRAMAAMRGNIQAMVLEEVARRRSAQTLLADAVQGSVEGILVADAETRIVLANEMAIGLLGLTDTNGALSAMVGTPAIDTLLALPERGASTAEIRKDDGRWLRLSRSPTRDGGFVAVCSDVSLLKEHEQALRQGNLRLDAALSSMSQGLCLFDSEGRLLVHNRRLGDLLGLDVERAGTSPHLRDLIALAGLSRQETPEGVVDLLTEQLALFDRQSGGSLCRALRAGCIVALEQHRTSDGGWIATYEDVTERHEAEARIVAMARGDALTGLPNRIVFAERLDEAAAHLAHGTAFAALCMDLDRFKEVNDTLGHPVGDSLLRAAAERLAACLRGGETLARLGGDEFAILQPRIASRKDVVALCQRLCAAFEDPFRLDGHTVTVGVSIGVALAPEHGQTPENLLKSADLALYRAKANGRGGWSFFEAEMDRELQERRALEADLRRAVTNAEFHLVYQPIIDLADGRVVSCEALLRWRHPERGLVPPAQFIPLAEEIGLITQIGSWVIRRACAEARAWPGGVAVAVNVSAMQFKNAALLDSVTEALKQSGLPANRLQLEITESVLLADNLAASTTLHVLKGLGIKIAMDDFGTGYSSLSYLQSFPFDKIKIDQSFTRRLDDAVSSEPIVRAVIGLGRSLGMKVTAEGIETGAQHERLRALGCDLGQGYLFSRPIAAALVTAFISKSREQAA